MIDNHLRSASLFPQASRSFFLILVWICSFVWLACSSHVIHTMEANQFVIIDQSESSTQMISKKSINSIPAPKVVITHLSYVSDQDAMIRFPATRIDLVTYNEKITEILTNWMQKNHFRVLQRSWMFHYITDTVLNYIFEKTSARYVMIPILLSVSYDLSVRLDIQIWDLHQRERILNFALPIDSPKTIPITKNHKLDVQIIVMQQLNRITELLEPMIIYDTGKTPIH